MAVKNYTKLECCSCGNNSTFTDKEIKEKKYHPFIIIDLPVPNKGHRCEPRQQTICVTCARGFHDEGVKMNIVFN